MRDGGMLPDQVPGLWVQVPNSPPLVLRSHDVPGLAQSTEGLGPCDNNWFQKNQILKKLKGRDQLEDLDVDGNISKWILQKQD